MFLRALLAISCSVTVYAENATMTLPISDDFSQSELPGRNLGRGPWMVKDHMASCVQDDELFKKAQDHGPLMTYNAPFTDATISFSYKPDAQVKAMLFTCNGLSGHAFRIVAKKELGVIQIHEREGEEKGSPATDAPALKPDVWTTISVTFSGPKATVTIGDYQKVIEHPSYAQPKKNVTIGFSYGSLAVKEVKMSAP